MAEREWSPEELCDRMERNISPESPEEAVARAPYERLIQRIRDLPDVSPPPGWEDRAVERWQNRRLGIALAVGVSVLIWVVAVVLLLSLK